MQKRIKNGYFNILILLALVSKRVVPAAIEPFDAYITIVLAYLTNTVNKARLAVSTANLDALTTLVNDPDTGWNALHTLHSASSTRTADVNTDLAISEITITHLLESIYRDIPRSAMLTADYSTLHIAKLSDTKSSPKNHKHTFRENVLERRCNCRFSNPSGPRFGPCTHGSSCRWHRSGRCSIKGRRGHSNGYIHM